MTRIITGRSRKPGVSRAKVQLNGVPKSRVLQFGNQKVKANHLLPLQDSTDLFKIGDFDGLRSRLHSDGVILVRGLIPQQTALNARHLLLKTITDKGALAPGTDYRDGIIGCDDDGRYIPGFTVDALSGGLTDDRDDDVEGWLDVGTSQTMADVFDGKALRSFLQMLFGGADKFETLPDNTWLRLKGKGDVTIEHVDYYYFKRSTDMFEKYGQGNPVPVDIVSCPECKGPAKKGISLTCELCHRDYHEKCVDETARPAKSNATWHCQSCADSPLHLYTCWTALGHIDIPNSTLAFVSGSHNSTGYDRPRRNEQLPKSLSKSLRWSVPFEPLDPGDMFIFNVKTVHCANKNTSGLFRASTDTRISLTPIGRQSWPDLISKSQL